MPKWKQKPVCEGNFDWCVCLALPHGSQLFKSRHTLCQHPSLIPSLSFHLTRFFRPFSLNTSSLSRHLTPPSMRRWEKQAFTSLAIPYRNIHSLTVAGRRAFFFLEQFCFFNDSEIGRSERSHTLGKPRSKSKWRVWQRWLWLPGFCLWC